jgi:hypothetical protein
VDRSPCGRSSVAWRRLPSVLPALSAHPLAIACHRSACCQPLTPWARLLVVIGGLGSPAAARAVKMRR